MGNAEPVEPAVPVARSVPYAEASEPGAIAAAVGFADDETVAGLAMA
jgi:hypothetical protein